MRATPMLALPALWLGLACVTGRSPDAPPTPAAATAPPAAEPTLELRAVPFPEGTYTGQVLATAPPRVTRAEGTATVEVQVPFSSKGDATCLIVGQQLDAGGSIEAIVARTRLGARLRDQWVDDVERVPETGVLFLIVRRDDRTRVKVAAYRDRQKAFACVHEGPEEAPAFKRVAASLAVALRRFDEPPPADVVRLCTLKVGDGSVGFERLELGPAVGEIGEPRRAGRPGATIARVTTWMAFRDGPNGLALMELNDTETERAGNISTVSTVRLFAGQPDLKAALGRDPSGTYHAVVTARRGRYDGPLRVTGGEGLPGFEAIRERIRSELLPGRARELRIEQFDPTTSPEKATVKVYARAEREGEVIVTDGPITSRQFFDPDGFMTTSETTLSTGDVLSSSCRSVVGPSAPPAVVPFAPVAPSGPP
jgi:hypothetical protein